AWAGWASTASKGAGPASLLSGCDEGGGGLPLLLGNEKVAEGCGATRITVRQHDVVEAALAVHTALALHDAVTTARQIVRGALADEQVSHAECARVQVGVFGQARY